eukprot:TRINITY_DN25582_c0_g1_i1.p1 TRINITY_DN25582_c0_g1~~TRINITY_DN25582_c0_g1_i1.p1  ORF type:complete len:250 (+),score=57.15 TRINITY_DN25582_c0_g1_i1:65-751(+)
MAEPEGAQKPRNMLMPACVGVGAVAAAASVGVLPVACLAVGSAGGWFLGQHLKGGRRPKQAPGLDAEHGQMEDSEDSDDSEDEEGMHGDPETADQAMVHLAYFMQQLGLAGENAAGGLKGKAVAGNAADATGSADRTLICQGLHEAFSKLPKDRLEKVFATFISSAQQVPKPEDIKEMSDLQQEIKDLMPPVALQAMERQSHRFLPKGLEALAPDLDRLAATGARLSD